MFSTANDTLAPVYIGKPDANDVIPRRPVQYARSMMAWSLLPKASSVSEDSAIHRFLPRDGDNAPVVLQF